MAAARTDPAAAAQAMAADQRSMTSYYRERITGIPELAHRAQRNVHVMDGQVTDFQAFDAPLAAAV